MRLVNFKEVEMRQPQHASKAPQSAHENIFWHAATASEHYREAILGQKPATLWLTGLSGSGKSTLSREVERLLLQNGHACFVLDGDNLRHHLNSDLDFSAASRRENIRRAAEVAHLMNEAGIIVISALISPLREDRDMARKIIGAERFVEVWINTDVNICETRDPKGLYAKARAGLIPDFTGISAPYEPPASPELVIDTHKLPLELSGKMLFKHLENHFFEEK